MSRAHTAVLGLGANLGHRLAALQAAVDAIAADDATDVLAVSKVYVSAPVGGPEQPDYLNAAILVATDHRAWELLALVQRIEREHGRVRDVRWGPRTLDIDIVRFDDVVSTDPELTLPHPRAHERLFVVAPWLEIEPAAAHPTHGSLAGLVVALRDQQIEVADESLEAPGATP